MQKETNPAITKAKNNPAPHKWDSLIPSTDIAPYQKGSLLTCQIEASRIALLHVWWGRKSKPSYIVSGDSRQVEFFFFFTVKKEFNTWKKYLNNSIWSIFTCLNLAIWNVKGKCYHLTIRNNNDACMSSSSKAGTFPHRGLEWNCPLCHMLFFPGILSLPTFPWCWVFSSSRVSAIHKYPYCTIFKSHKNNLKQNC